MKKILSTALVAVALSIAMVSTISAKKTAQRGMMQKGGNKAAHMRNNAKRVQVALDVMKKTDNPVVKEEAKRTANERAKELLKDLQERTWAGDILPGRYTPEQVAMARQKYTDLEIQRDQLKRDIEIKQAELDGMSTRSMVFWTKAEGGKEEAHKIASQDMAELKSTLRDVEKAIRNQKVIAGAEYCNAIRMAIGAITAVGIAGGTYGIDKYTGGKLGVASRMEAGYEAIGSEMGELRTKGIRQYGSERGSAIYGKMGDFYQSTKDMIADLYNRIPDVPVFGAKARGKVETLEELNNQLGALIEQQATIEDQGSPAYIKADETIKNLRAKVQKAQDEAEAAVKLAEKKA